MDDSLYASLLQATVCIAPQAETFRGCGVLIDSDSKLVVTVAEVMGASENARAWPAIARCGDTQGQIHSSMETEIAARVVHRDETRQLVLLELEHLPDGLAALPMGEWTGSIGQSLYSVCHQDLNLSANENSSWSHSRGQLRDIIILPHYWAYKHVTPWMVGIEPSVAFCDVGTPITDKEGNLLAIGASRQPRGGEFLTQFFEVGTIRATLEAWKH